MRKGVTQVRTIKDTTRAWRMADQPTTHTDTKRRTWLHAEAAARRLGVVRPRIYQLIAARRLRTTRAHGLLYVLEKDVQMYKARRPEVLKMLHPTPVAG